MRRGGGRRGSDERVVAQFFDEGRVGRWAGPRRTGTGLAGVTAIAVDVRAEHVGNGADHLHGMADARTTGDGDHRREQDNREPYLPAPVRASEVGRTGHRVADSHRGLGVGRALVATILDLLQPFPVVTLFCSTDLVDYYEAVGFHPTNQVVLHRR